MSNVQIVDIENSNPQIPTQFDTDSGSAIPVGNVLEILGSTVANATNAKPLFTTGSGNTVTAEIQVGAAITGAPADSNDAGLVSFDDTQFTVDANGFVQLAGGSLAIDSITGDDGTAVFPDSSGNLNFNGSVVANAANSKPVFFDGDAGSNTQDLEIQLATAVGSPPADSNDAGLASFNSNHFTITSNGFVSLLGGDAAIDQIAVDFNTAPGTDPVIPDSSGEITVSGSTVANATNSNAPIATHSRAANAYNIEIQVAAAVTGAPGDKFDAGICSFDDTEFVVDADGFVSLVGTSGAPAIQKIDGDGGGAVGPNAAGTVFIQGSTVPNAHNSKPVWTEDTPGSNLQEIEVQVGAAISGAPGDKNDAGLASFEAAEFDVDTDGYVSRDTRVLMTDGYVENLGISYAAGSGTFTIQAADGNSLSSSNPGYVVLQSAATPGQLVVHKLTADQSFIDDNGSSEIINNTFGFDSGTAVTVDVPFFIYAVTNDSDDAIQFMISRIPYRKTSPATANIAAPDDAVASTQGSFFSFDNITETEFDENPCQAIGSFRMQMSSSDDWTVQTLNSTDGIGQFQESVLFTHPLGQFGADSGTYCIPNGGTCPSFTTISGRYFIKRDGVCRIVINLDGDDGADGAGSVVARVSIPFAPGNTQSLVYQLRYAGLNFKTGNFVVKSGNNYAELTFEDNADEFINWGAFTNGGRRIKTGGFYNVGQA